MLESKTRTFPIQSSQMSRSHDFAVQIDLVDEGACVSTLDNTGESKHTRCPDAKMPRCYTLFFLELIERQRGQGFVGW